MPSWERLGRHYGVRAGVTCVLAGLTAVTCGSVVCAAPKPRSPSGSMGPRLIRRSMSNKRLWQARPFAHRRGWASYRTGVNTMDLVAQQYGEANRDLNARIKRALDPNHILSPGKQGIR